MVHFMILRLTISPLPLVKRDGGSIVALQFFVDLQSFHLQMKHAYIHAFIYSLDSDEIPIHDSLSWSLQSAQRPWLTWAPEASLPSWHSASPTALWKVSAENLHQVLLLKARGWMVYWGKGGNKYYLNVKAEKLLNKTQIRKKHLPCQKIKATQKLTSADIFSHTKGYINHIVQLVKMV